MTTINVEAPGGTYPVFVSGGMSGEEKSWLVPALDYLKGRAPIIITSPRVAKHCLPAVKSSLKIKNPRVLTIPDGERFKNLKTVTKAYAGLARLAADRSTPILLLGGGVIGDLGGFVAATYLRGLPFLQIGTTLVAQVDSSIGGKLGIDLEQGKNLVGVFGQPLAVFSHVPFLRTLPPREIIGGLAEVLKYGVIRDPRLFELVQEDFSRIMRRDTDVLREIVSRSSAIKAEVVSQDEKESGLRMILNFGHTFGHALERLTGYKKFLHGEAVGIGMILAAELSRRLGHCDTTSVDHVRQAVAQTGLPTRFPKFSKSQWARALSVDKKSREGKIHFVAMLGIGRVVTQPLSAVEMVEGVGDLL